MSAEKYPSSLLQQYISKEESLKFFRTFNGNEDNLYGYLLAEKGNFMLIRGSKDFHLDGYYILRKDQVDSIRCSSVEKTTKRIMKKEGISKNILTIPMLTLAGWQEIFQQVKKRDYHVIIESKLEEELDFNIGPVKKMNKTSVYIQFYDAKGKLDDFLTVIPYESIVKLEFLDGYSSTFRKYLKPA